MLWETSTRKSINFLIVKQFNSVGSEWEYPQTCQILDDGSNFPIIGIVFPALSDLYSNFVTKLLHTESNLAFEKWGVLIMPLKSRVSTAIAWFSLTSLKESLCWKSFLWVVIFSWSTASFCLAFSLFLEPFCFRLTLFEVL